MRGKALVLALWVAAVLLGGLFAGQHAVFAADSKKPPAPAAKSSKPAASTPGKGNVGAGDDIPVADEAVMDEVGDAIAVGEDGVVDTDEGPTVPRPRTRIGAPVDLSKPMTEEPSGPPVDFSLTARLSPDLPTLSTGVVWRVFGEREGTDGRLPLLTQVNGGTIQVKLAPGSYLVNAAYGRAGATKRIVVAANGGKDEFVLNAGGLRLTALVGKDSPIPANLLYFDVYVDDGGIDGERTLVISHAAPTKILRLPAGTYYVVSHYGDGNAQVRAAIKVDPGKLTDATLFHQAARVTLKLVSERGGEALANTAWSVQKPSGEPLGESVGAYHQAILAAGQYQAVARHDGKTYQAPFVVENDVNRDIEIIGK